MKMTEDKTLVKTSVELRIERLKVAATYVVLGSVYLSLRRVVELPSNPIIGTNPSPLAVEIMGVAIGTVVAYALILLWQKAGLWLGTMEVDDDQ